MAVPQGSTIFNTAYFSSLENRVNAVGSCAELQSLVTEEFASIQGVSSAITAQLAFLEPIQALVSGGVPAANPTAIVTWIETFISAFLSPYIVPYITMAAQVTELTAQIAALTSAIESAQAKFPSCSISIPPIT